MRRLLGFNFPNKSTVTVSVDGGAGFSSRGFDRGQAVDSRQPRARTSTRQVRSEANMGGVAHSAA